MSPALEILGFSLTWIGFGVVSGWWASRWSPTALDRDTWLTRGRAWELDGRWYERIGVRRWKDRLPEAGNFFGNGVSKRNLGGSGRRDLLRFSAETRRAEAVHWLNIGFAPTFVLWTSPTIAAVMTAFALVAHLPFVIIQRYNRFRIARVLRRRAAHGRQSGVERAADK